MNTHISACTSAMVWTIASYLRDRHWHMTEIMAGAFAGLASITAGTYTYIHTYIYITVTVTLAGANGTGTIQLQLFYVLD